MKEPKHWWVISLEPDVGMIAMSNALTQSDCICNFIRKSNAFDNWKVAEKSGYRAVKVKITEVKKK